MANKNFDIDWNGSKATIIFDDDLNYGEFSQILKSTVDVTNIVAGQIKINIDGYISQILQKTIRQAPFNPNKDELSKIGKKTMNIIVKEILASYPLGDSLESWAIAMLGNTEQMKSLIESMPSVQVNADGTKSKLTDSPSST